MSEISEASYEACYGSDSNLVLLEETPVLINKFEKAVHDKKSTEVRQIFGRLLCLRQKFQTNNTVVAKRQITGSTDLTQELYEFYEDLQEQDIPPLFFFDVDEDDIPKFSLAFVVDDTGSMRDEIDSVKILIKAIISAEKSSPVFYILGTFNDPGKSRLMIVSHEAKKKRSNATTE